MKESRVNLSKRNPYLADLPAMKSISRRSRATAIGSLAILMWASLALLTALTAPVPPFLLIALTFGVAFAFTLIRWSWLGWEALVIRLKQPWPVWLLGIGGLFGYHVLYIVALRLVPVAEASLIAYLWPLLIVLLSSLLLKIALRWQHVAGAMIGFAGVVLLKGEAWGSVLAEWRGGEMLGYGAALLAALTWALYSVLSRKFANAPTDVIGAYCGIAAFLGLVCHLGFEETQWPFEWKGWIAILVLGLGPMGLAFFVWDYGVKHGDIRLLGVLSYGAPLFSTILLTLSGVTAVSWALAGGCFLIAAGAALAGYRSKTTGEWDGK